MCLRLWDLTAGLGSSLYDVVNRYSKTGDSSLRIIYSKEQFFETPIIVYLKNLGLRLVFEPIGQKLEFIEVVDFSLLRFTYDANSTSYTLNRNGSEPVFKDVYNKIFGPTLPGYLTKQGKYVLSYPGIAFLFGLPEEVVSTFKGRNEVSDKQKLINTLSASCITCQSLIVYNHLLLGGEGPGVSWDKYYEQFCKTLFPTTKIVQHKLERALLLKQNNFVDAAGEPKKHTIKKRYISLANIEIILYAGLIKFNFASHYKNFKLFVLTIGKTKQQNILYHLGEPDSTCLKVDFRYELYREKTSHDSTESNTGSQEVEATNEVFHNYFRYGFDILYSTDNAYGSVVKKVIIYNNIPNSVCFGKYNKVNWLMKGWGNSPLDELEVNYEVPSYELKPVELQPPNIYFPQFDKAEKPQQCETWTWTEGISLLNLASSELYFSEINQENFKVQHDKSNQLVDFDASNFISLDRSNYFPWEDDTEIIDMVLLDETPDPKPSIKPWGLSKLYGFDRCIWEVLTDNDAIASITLY